MRILSAIKNTIINKLQLNTICMVYDIAQFGNYEDGNKNNFTYKFTNNPRNNEIFASYNLNDIAGNGNTISKALNIMAWVDKNTEYDGASPLPPSLPNVILEYAYKKPDNKINCANRAILFCDALMSIGIFAIPIRLQNSITPIKNVKLGTDIHCHWIAHVFLPEQMNWVAFDPSFNNIFSDGNNNYLDVITMAKLIKNHNPIFAISNNIKTKNGLYCVLSGLMSISIFSGNDYQIRSDFDSMLHLIPLKYLKEAEKLSQLPAFKGQWFFQQLAICKKISVREFLTPPKMED